MMTTRRVLLQVTVASLAAWTAPAVPAAPWLLRKSPGESLSLHMDQPFLDLAGNGLGYRPCAMLGGALALSTLDETELRMRHPWL